MKYCSNCKNEKPKSEFQVRKASNDGLTASCKECLKKRDAERYIGERERRAIQHKEYMGTEKGKAVHSKATFDWKQRNKVRRAAHVILGNAIRSGKVTKLPCFVCGEEAQAHHPDYDRPLDVIWLCPSHHKQAHALVKGEKEISKENM